MKSQQKNVTVDSNAISNFILNEVIEQDVLDYINKPLDTVDLIRIDNANMWMIEDTVTFSNIMLEELEFNNIDTFEAKATSTKIMSIEDKLTEVQKDVLTDITAPLQNMFDEMFMYVSKEFA